MSDETEAPIAPTPDAGGVGVFHNYRLDQRLGHEELALVYLATHMALDRRVQIRILRRSDWVSVSRFQLAGRLAARLSHPHLVPVIDAGHDPQVGDFMVMPDLGARPLDQLLASGPLEPLAAVRIAAQIGAALDYLHTQGIIHRDVQPCHIAVNDQGTAYLGNLSLAVAPDGPDLSELIDADVLTPYAAPEQTLQSGHATPALDIYALGVVLHEMLFGTLPAPDLASRPFASELPDLIEIEQVMRRMLAHAPLQRYGSAASVTAALRHCLRQLLDAEQPEMNEERWDATAEWLENPLETVMESLLDGDLLRRSRARADMIHRTGAIRRLLDRWSRQGLWRRRQLGQLIQPEHVVSYNAYRYRLEVSYDRREPPFSRLRPIGDSVADDTGAPLPDRWSVLVPDTEPFAAVVPTPWPIPGSRRVVSCATCDGAITLTCAACDGSGVGRPRRSGATGSCTPCGGSGQLTCTACEGHGSQIEEVVFLWSRRAVRHQAADETPGPPQHSMHAQDVVMFAGPIELRDPRWLQIAPLRGLVEQAMRAAEADERPLAAHLEVRGVPVTEVNYVRNQHRGTMWLVGFDNRVVGDRWVYDWERAALYGAVLALVVVLVALVLVWRGV
ncbi:MAG: protein kinase [Chloroflexi bacterium]|nr:protein kinase [Chloroflexota bacterium]